MSRKTHIPIFKILFCDLIALCICAALIWWGNRSLQVCRFERTFSTLPEGFDGCRMVVLTDLHGAEFGADNEKLFAAVAKQTPDYIFYLGDLEDAYRGAVAGYAETLAIELSAIAPTYYVTGNHEWGIGGVSALKQRLTDNGVSVLSNEYVTIERNGDEIVLAGIDDPSGRADQKTPEALFQELREAKPDAFCLLLAHRACLFPTEYSLLGADLTLSGHGHGGVWRLPFTDGLIGNSKDLFPSYTSGFYEENGVTLFASRGLGNSGNTFRIGNRPEVAVLTLYSEKG